MFCVQVELLTGRFVATDYSDRLTAEWPPHPARLFSALVAAYAADPRDDEREALRWLEALPAPQVAASPHAARDVVTVYVPVNDGTVVGETEGRSPAAVKKALQPGTRVSEAEIATALSLLPEQRGRQPRAFPSVTPFEARFALVWPEVQVPSEHREALDRLCARVTRVGHSSSLVSVHLPAVSPAVSWVPDPEGPVTLRVPQDGQLARLEAAFERHQESLPRVMPAAFARYAPVGAQPRRAEPPRSCFAGDWIVLARVDGDRLPLRAALALTQAVRGALLHHAPDPRAEVLSGHAVDGRPSARDHLAIAPLPFVGAQHADGEIKGVALLLPRDLEPALVLPVLRAIGAWEQACRVGDHVQDEHPPLTVRMGRDGCVRLALLEDPGPLSLRAESWSRPSRAWVSVTPVALDHNPGELRRRSIADPQPESERIVRASARAAESLRRAAVRIGLPEPAAIELSPQALIRGGRPVRAFPGFRAGGHPKVLVHARLVFSEPVAGPVLLGAGRYLGYGLFRPVEDATP